VYCRKSGPRLREKCGNRRNSKLPFALQGNERLNFAILVALPQVRAYATWQSRTLPRCNGTAIAQDQPAALSLSAMVSQYFIVGMFRTERAEIKALAATVKEQTSLIRKVSERLEASKAPHLVADNQ